MSRRLRLCVAGVLGLLLVGCGAGKGELSIPRAFYNNAGTSSASPQFAAIGGGVPEGVQATFVNDTLLLRGEHFRLSMKVFFGMNSALARRPDSIFTTARHLLPGTPFVYTDPVTSQQTILEVEAKSIEFVNGNEIRVKIPPEVACSPNFTNPIVRFYGGDGSSVPADDLLHVVGPRCIALTPNKGLDVGGFAVTLHGDFFSPYTQVAFRYVDPATGNTHVVGNTPATDIVELFVDRHTMVIPNWPGVVPNSTLGLADELPVDLLLFENIDSINGSLQLEPDFGGVSPCSSLLPESPEAPLQYNGVRNSEKAEAFVFLPTGVTDYPSIAGITPESGTEVGGNTVVIHGDQFDAFSADISDPDNPGIGIECPPDSGHYIPPLEAILVDRQTLVITMPPCSVDIPETVNFCMRNKFSIDNPGGVASTGPNGDCVVFEDIYTYLPIPPIAPPVVTAIYPQTEDDPPLGAAHDYGLERLLVTGDWFDYETTLNGGFEFLLPDGTIVQTQRTILHNRNLLEIFTKRLPASVYPLTADLIAGVRVRNVVGHADFSNMVRFQAMPDAGVPVLDRIVPTSGPASGGNQVLLHGSNFDTTSQVLFGGEPAADVQFVSSALLIAEAPPGAVGTTAVYVRDGTDETESASYERTNEAADNCPILGALDPTEGSSTGGYTILAYGINFSPTSHVEFDVGSGNMSPLVRYISPNLLLVEVPEARPEQIGAAIPVGVTDPLRGCDEVIETVDFTYLGFGKPEILYVDTTVEVPITETDYPALGVEGGDTMLVIGRNFDQMTTFDITQPQGGETVVSCTDVKVLTPNLAVMKSPAAPNEEAGLADLKAHNTFGDSDPFTVEYVEPGPPAILDVRNLDDGTTTSPIDANDRILIFGDSFFDPVTVRLTGCDLSEEGETVTVTLTSPDVTLVEDHLIGVNIPADTFCEGPLLVEVETMYGTAAFTDDEGQPAFELIGPQPPVVLGIFPTRLNSHGGEEAILFGRYFTDTTRFSLRSDLMTEGDFNDVLATRFVSDSVAIVVTPGLPGGMPPTGVSGDAKAEEMDPALRAKIGGDEKFTITEDLFRVIDADQPVLLGVYPDHGSIAGGEQVLLIGSSFLTATGEPNISGIHFVDPVLGDIGTYTMAAPEDLPLDSLDPANRGKYTVLNDHEILLITNVRDPIAPEDEVAPTDVLIESIEGNTELQGGYAYTNTPGVRTPVLLGITPNETRLNGGTSHLLSGGFLTEADRIVLTRDSDEATLAIPTDAGAFSEVNDNFLVFVMPDLSETFAEGDVLDVHAEKDVGGGTLVSNTLHMALRVSFAGPPFITPTLSPAAGSAFGGTVVEITGGLFTSNSQVLFGTIPARIVVFDGATRLLAVAPNLPVDAPDPGVDLRNLDSSDGTVDVAVFTQGGWAVLPDAFTFEPAGPTVSSCTPDEVDEGATAHLMVTGMNFVAGETTVTSSESATIANLVVHDFTHLSFDYTAPTYVPGTEGPKIDSLTFATNMGTAPGACEITIHLTPFIETIETTFSLNHGSVPTLGVEDGGFVKVMVEGANFHQGFWLAQQTKANRQDDVYDEFEEIDAADPFTDFGQFKVTSDTTMELTVPNIFNNETPTLIDGNPNIGPVTLHLRADGTEISVPEAYSYVPSLMDFERYTYTLPPSETGGMPWAVTTGDINADGVPDAAIIANHPVDAYVMIADTFGDAVDVNGDGKMPDFAGTFTAYPINSTEYGFHHDADPYPADAEHLMAVKLAQLDDDDELEVLIPGDGNSTDDGMILIVNTDSSGFDDLSFFIPNTGVADRIASLTICDFDGDDRDDFAFFDDDHGPTRRIGIVTSPVSAFTFVEAYYDTPDAYDDLQTGELVSGDWDGDGRSDLMYGFVGIEAWTYGDLSDYDLIVVDIDHDTAAVLSQKAITNLGGPCGEIEVLDIDGDGKDDAVPMMEYHAQSSTLFGIGETESGSGFGIILDPMGLEADSFTLLGYHQTIFSALGDFNGDNVLDLCTANETNEFVIHLGNGTDGFVPVNRAWNVSDAQRGNDVGPGGVATADMNGDGLAEIFVTVQGWYPLNMDLWNNTSR